MPKLLCATPLRGAFSRISEHLLPRLAKAFEQVDLHALDMATAEELPEWEHGEVGCGNFGLHDDGDYTHRLFISSLENLSRMSGVYGIPALDSINYAWAGIDSPFIEHELAQTASFFDFFVCMSGMAQGAYKGVLQDLGGKTPKAVFKGAFESKVIRPGVDIETFRPTDEYRRGFSRAEIRQAMFNGNVSDRDLLVTITNPLDFSTAAATAHRLPLYTDRKVWTRVCYDPTPNMQMVLAGSELGRVIVGEYKGDMNLLYNASDVVLCTSPRSAWPFDVTEPMAAGCVVAAPDDHTYLDCISQERGIELPASLFEFDPPARRVLPDAAARKIGEVFAEDGNFRTVRDNGITWAHGANSTASWDYCASEWLRLFGMA